MARQRRDRRELMLIAKTATASPAGRRVIFGVLGLAALAAVVVTMTISALIGGQRSQQAASTTYAASDAAIAGIPAAILPIYIATGRRYGLDWAIIAALAFVETGHGAGNRVGWTNFHGCCAGFMQFCVIDGCPSVGPQRLSISQVQAGTWRAYRRDGNRDGVYDPWNPADAIPATANMLKANGAPRDYQRALSVYNPGAPWYPAKILDKAVEYRGALKAAGSIPPSGPLLARHANGASVLRLATGPSPRITLTGAQRNDLSTGQIDGKVTTLLVAIAQQHRITITSLKTDHGLTTTRGTISNHSAGRAVDIGTVDGEKCNSIAHGRFGECWNLAVQLARIKGTLHPTELIYGLDPDGNGPAFACLTSRCGGNHSDHIHAGYRR